ncbi:GyrI-like domain-containing protein [Paenibacillus sp. GYB003]|uniref:GyrI-like domain-containing protein n=1 Tax=Paenibacillus sp. GYB003 TaxID=2994392 RepID=UPI002F961F1D
MPIVDNRKSYGSVYRMKPDAIEVVQVPPMQFIVHEGKGRLSGTGRPEQDCWAIWKTVNQLKRISKERDGYQFMLMPHEIVWHEQIGDDEWTFTEMMHVPDRITIDMYEEARRNVEKRYRNEIVPDTRFVSINQGLCIQKLHVGHYRESARTVEQLYRFAETGGYKITGDRREVYVNPPLCYPTPDRWETIVRLQVSEA